MRSELPKPLHDVCGRTLLGWVVSSLDPTRFGVVSVVVGHGKELVVGSLATAFPERSFVYAEQHSQRGTGDAAAVGLAELDLVDASFSDDDHVVVLPGDTPLLQPETVTAFVEAHIASGAAGTLVTARIEDPTGYGRIVRDKNGGVRAIVEHRDCSEEELQVNEINAGMYCFRRAFLGPALRMIDSDNSQGELYLTDVIGVLAEAGHPVSGFVADAAEIAGVNDRAQLSDAALLRQAAIIREHQRSGVSIIQPGSTVIDADVVIDPDATIHSGSVLQGRTRVGAGAIIGPNTQLRDVTIGAGAQVPHSVILGAHVGDGEHVAPFTHQGSS